MKSLYRRQFAMMAAVILVAFLLLGSAFSALSYQYIVGDKQEVMSRNASDIADFTAGYLTRGFGSSIQDSGYQMYIASLARISDSTVLLAENNGTVVFAAAPDGGRDLSALLGRQVPQDWMDRVSREGSAAGRSGLSGLLPELSYVTAAPILRYNYMTDTTYLLGVVLVTSELTALSGMWSDLAAIFLLVAAVVLLLAAGASSLTSLWQTKPLKEMADAVRRLLCWQR